MIQDMKIIDSHAHLKHGDKARTEYTAASIVAAMDAADIAQSVVFAMCTSTMQSIAMARQAVSEFPDRLIPYAYALPSFERIAVDEIREAIVQEQFRGIKIHAGECRLSDYIVDPVLKLAGEHGVPCLVDFLGDVSPARRLAHAFPQTPLIVAHLGRYRCEDRAVLDRFVQLAESCANVYLDTSGVLIDEAIEDAVARVGAGRVLFGTDGPHEAPDTAGFARSHVQQIQSLKLSDADKEAILGGTIANLLGLTI